MGLSFEYGPAVAREDGIRLIRAARGGFLAHVRTPGREGSPALARAVPAVRKRGGRKLVITPDGKTHRARPRVDSALVKAIARAHRWQRLLENGACGSITELAAAEKIDRSYLCRVLQLTLLAPEIVQAILDGRQPEE